MRKRILSLAAGAVGGLFVGCGTETKIDHAPDPKAKHTNVPVKSLYERLGGRPAITAVVDKFVPEAAKDPAVDFTRGGGHPVDVAMIKKQLVDYIGENTGGPEKYMGRNMKDSHKGMRITAAQFNAIAGHLKKALIDCGVKDPELTEVMTFAAGTAKDIIEVP